MSSLNGDAPCYQCSTSVNILWSTENDLWNTVVRSDLSPWGDRDPILCVTCFVTLCVQRGHDPGGWRLNAVYTARGETL